MSSGAGGTINLVPITIEETTAASVTGPQPVGSRGARRIHWNRAGFHANEGGTPNGYPYNALTQRDGYGRVVPGITDANQWILQFNNVGNPNMTWNGASTGSNKYGIIEGWAMVPTSAGATVKIGAYPVSGNVQSILYTGSSPFDCVERAGGTPSVVFTHPIAQSRCVCASSLGFNLVFFRVLAHDTFDTGGFQIYWNIGAADVNIPTDSVIPTDGSLAANPLATYTGDPCDIITLTPTIRTGWQNILTGQNLEQDGVTPVVFNNPCSASVKLV